MREAGGKEGDLPVKGAGKDKVVVYGELVEAVVEVAVVDEAAGFVDDYQGEDDPLSN